MIITPVAVRINMRWLKFLNHTEISKFIAIYFAVIEHLTAD